MLGRPQALLGQFEFSQVAVHSSTADPKRLEAVKFASKACDSEAPASVAGNQSSTSLVVPSVDVNFQWPNWFRGVWARLTLFVVILQGSLAGSTQEKLECMMGDGLMRHLVPVVYWRVYPALVMV